MLLHAELIENTSLAPDAAPDLEILSPPWITLRFDVNFRPTILEVRILSDAGYRLNKTASGWVWKACNCITTRAVAASYDADVQVDIGFCY